jgi:flagellar basal-body rod protein FlgC
MQDRFREARAAVFRAVGDDVGIATVQVDRVVASATPPTRRHEPSHPLADANGDIWQAGVDSNAEMVEMVEAARQYQNNVQVLETAKSLILDTIRIGR